MPVPVTFAGQTYQIPQRGETGWYALTAYLVALSQAQTRSQTTFNLRTVSSGTAITSTDTFIAANMTSGSFSVAFPSAALNPGRLIGVIITAGTNELALLPNGADTFANISGAGYGFSGVGSAVYFVAVGSNWQIVSAVGAPTGPLPRPIADTTNGTVASNFAQPYFTASTSVSNGQSCAITFASSRSPYELEINASSTQYLTVKCGFATTAISSPYDPFGLFLTSDAGTGIYVSKSATSNVVTVKNRLGTSANFQITATSALITSVTAWS